MTAITKKHALGIAGISLLAACGGGGGTGSYSGGVSGSVAPVYADGPTDTVSASLIDTGATGYASVVQPMTTRGALTGVKIRLSPDRSTAYVTVNGSSYTLDQGVGYSASGGTYASTTNASAPIIAITNGTDYATITYTDASGLMGFGHVGIETPTAGLPTGAVTYHGTYSANIWPKSMAGSPDVMLDDIELEIDFSGGDVTGHLEDGGLQIGTVTGSVSDSRISGTFDITGGTHTGTLDFAGALYGDQAETAAGAFLGTVTDGTDDFFATGTFDADRP